MKLRRKWVNFPLKYINLCVVFWKNYNTRKNVPRPPVVTNIMYAWTICLGNCLTSIKAEWALGGARMCISAWTICFGECGWGIVATTWLLGQCRRWMAKVRCISITCYTTFYNNFTTSWNYLATIKVESCALKLLQATTRQENKRRMV